MSKFFIKLGTVFNTIGSFGVGYYVAKFNLLDPTVLVSPDGVILHTLDYIQNLQLFGSIIILGIGLILRTRDILNRKHEKEHLLCDMKRKEDANIHQGEEYLDEIAHLQRQIKNLTARFNDTKIVLGNVIKPYVRDFVKEEIEEVKKQHVLGKAEIPHPPPPPPKRKLSEDVRIG